MANSLHGSGPFLRKVGARFLVGFFQTFSTWLNGQLATYIGETTYKVATVLEPAVVTFGAVYIMVWGYLQLTGRVEQPFVVGLKRIITLAVVLGVSLHLWLYNQVIVDTFYKAPVEFAAALAGAQEPVAVLDTIWNNGGTVADQLFHNGSILQPTAFVGFYFEGLIVWILVGLLCVYTMFLLSLSSIALSVLLALGPLFFLALLFEHTRRWFDGWIAQLTNYALISILTVLVSTLLLQLVASFTKQTADLGPGVVTVDILDMLLVAVLVFLVMRQVMPIAAGIAGGTALSSFGTVSGFIRGTAHQTARYGLKYMEKIGF
jgi:type IV secretion system protein VirB6